MECSNCKTSIPPKGQRALYFPHYCSGKRLMCADCSIYYYGKELPRTKRTSDSKIFGFHFNNNKMRLLELKHPEL